MTSSWKFFDMAIHLAFIESRKAMITNNCKSMRLLAVTLAILAALCGCAPTTSHLSSTPLDARWKTAEFRVSFKAGPHGLEKPRSFSYYQIELTTLDKQERAIVMESAHSIEGFNCVTNGQPENYIRIIEDPSGRALLIEENIPNDCGPCSNYIWVRLDSNDFILGSFLKLPSATTGPLGGIDYEYPKVISLNGSELTCRYGSGSTIRVDINKLETAESPAFPG